MMPSVLIPILSTEFPKLDAVFETKGLDKVFLLLVVDQSSSKEFDFLTSEIMSGRRAMAEVEKKIKEKNIPVESTLVWGDTVDQITQFSNLKKASKLFLEKSSSKSFKEFVKKIEKTVKAKIELI